MCVCSCLGGCVIVCVCMCLGVFICVCMCALGVYVCMCMRAIVCLGAFATVLKHKANRPCTGDPDFTQRIQ